MKQELAGLVHAIPVIGASERGAAPGRLSRGSRGPLRLHAPHDQRATFVELFFDLVFVFAVTEVTGFAGDHLDAGGLLRAVLVFWLIWWAWTQWTWTLNPADTEHALVRVGTMLATAVAFLMAVSAARAFEDGGGFWFAAPYIAVRALGLGLNARVAAERAEHFAAVRYFALLSTSGLTAVLIGAALDGDARISLWLVTIALDLMAARVAGGHPSWHLHAAHFAERNGLFMIIALGESLIVAAGGVVGVERTGQVVAVAVGAVALTGLLWWLYFGWLKDALEWRLTNLSAAAQSHFARDAYSLLHFLMVGGIVGVAVGLEEMAAHPGAALEPEVLAAFGAGLGLVLGGSAGAYARATRRVLWPRLGGLALLGISLPLAADLEPGWILLIAASALGAIVAVESSFPPPVRVATPEPRPHEIHQHPVALTSAHRAEGETNPHANPHA